jgi:hypothetical protein
LEKESLLDISKEIAEELRKRGLKVVRPSLRGSCVEIAVEANDFVFFLYVFRRSSGKGVIVKMTGEPKGCEGSLLTPKGLFVLGEEIDDVIEKILSKIERLRELSRRVLI